MGVAVAVDETAILRLSVEGDQRMRSIYLGEGM